MEFYCEINYRSQNNFQNLLMQKDISTLSVLKQTTREKDFTNILFANQIKQSFITLIFNHSGVKPIKSIVCRHQLTLWFLHLNAVLC